MNKCYKIAGLTVEMDVMGRTEIQAEPYLTDPVDKPDMLLMHRFDEFYALHSQWSVETAQYVFTAAVFYTELLRFQGLVLHSSAVVVDGRAYLFSAASGIGKSTHTRLWLERFGQRAYILNDDKPALRLINGVWYAFGTPWSGKNNINRPECAPLAGIAILKRGEENRIYRHTGPKAIFDVMQQTMRPPNKREELLELVDQLVTQVPIWNLYCNTDPQAAMVAYSAMSGE